jgi:F-type H+-transporting ATPase subunit b
MLNATEATDRIFGLDTQTLYQAIFTMVNVLLLFGILSFLLFIPVKNFMEKRTERIKTNIVEATNSREEAEAIKANYDEKIKNINKEADEILAVARKKAVAREDEIIREARAEADRIMDRAHLEIEREKEQAKDDMRKEIVEVATIMASKFVASSMDNKTRDALIDETINSMGDSTWLN